MSVSVLLTQRAEREIREIRDWIRARSPAGASSWLDALEDAFAQLRQRTASSSPALEADDLALDLRQLTFKTRRGNPYRLVFIVRDDSVYVVAVRGAGQDLLRPDDFVVPN